MRWSSGVDGDFVSELSLIYVTQDLYTTRDLYTSHVIVYSIHHLQRKNVGTILLQVHKCPRNIQKLFLYQIKQSLVTFAFRVLIMELFTIWVTDVPDIGSYKL